MGVFRVEDAARIGIPKTTLNRRVDTGEVIRVGRGLNLHAKSRLHPTKINFAVACATFGPKSVIGGITALFHYDLIEQVPITIWVLVPTRRRPDKRICIVASVLTLRLTSVFWTTGVIASPQSNGVWWKLSVMHQKLDSVPPCMPRGQRSLKSLPIRQRFSVQRRSLKSKSSSINIGKR